MSIPPGSRRAPPADADDLRVEAIAAQLEEAEQQRLADYGIEEATRARTHDQPHDPAGRRRRGQRRHDRPHDDPNELGAREQAPRDPPRKSIMGWGAKCLESAVGASRHEPTPYDPQEAYMQKRPPDRPQRVPLAPAPSSTSAPEGMERAREEARRYLLDTVRLFAGIALAPDSEAALHTRMLCAKEIVAIAGVIPQATPAPPPYQGADDSREPA